MLFYEGLEDIIFSRYQKNNCDEFVVLSGYLGPIPVERLKNLPFHTTVIYGMYGAEGIQFSLHNALLKIHKAHQNVDVIYSTMPIHSKCYIWKKHGQIVDVLIGSANFSVNGLTIPYKEVLSDISDTSYNSLSSYLDIILSCSISCDLAIANPEKSKIHFAPQLKHSIQGVCTLPLYSETKGTKFVQEASGINWCLSAKGNVAPGDGYIPIPTECVRAFPEMFPKKQLSPHKSTGVGRSQRHNDAIEVLWDDGRVMTCLLEGSSDINLAGIRGGPKEKYPKNLASHPKKNVLGEYLRHRIGVSLDHKVTIEDFKKYGRDTIDISLLGEGIYFFDFSV